MNENEMNKAIVASSSLCLFATLRPCVFALKSGVPQRADGLDSLPVSKGWLIHA